MKVFFIGMAACVAALAQNVTLSNTTSASMGMDFVSGDSFRLSITGAVPYQAVTLLETKNGVSTTPSPWYAGQTDGNGNLTLTGVETSEYVAEYTQQWYVGGWR